MATLEQVKDLRFRTGCGVVDCKQALEEARGDVEAAITILRKRGQVKATKKSSRATREGVVASYVHSNNKIAVLVSLLCETDFVARNARFQALAHDIAVHIAAADPLVVKPEDMPEAVLNEERAIAEEQAKKGNKPAAIQDKIIAGKIQSFQAEHALLTQPFVKDPAKTIADLITEAVTELGENITVGEFKRIAI